MEIIDNTISWISHSVWYVIKTSYFIHINLYTMFEKYAEIYPYATVFLGVVIILTILELVVLTYKYGKLGDYMDIGGKGLRFYLYATFFAPFLLPVFLYLDVKEKYL